MAEKVGKETGQTTKAGRPVYETPEGEMVSEKSATIKLGNKYINVPSIHDGVKYSEDELLQMLKENKIEATSVHDSLEEAVKSAQERSSNLLAKGGSMESQMKLFEEGGLYQEGGTMDPVSGNEVPTGSLQEEVRDDIDAKLSEGEFVFPADVVRYIGLENLMKLRQKAKEGLAKMASMGQMGNAEEATMDDDDGEYDAEIDELIDQFDPEAEDEMEFAEGGVVPQYDIPGFQQPRYRTGPTKTYEELMGGASPLPQYETRQYIGPNGDIISVTFLNGKPTAQIPEGYKPYKGELVQAKVEQPTTGATTGGDDKDDKSREQEEADREQYNSYLDRMNKLAELDPDFAKTWSQDPQSKVKAGMSLKDTIANFTKSGGILGGVLSTVSTSSAAADSRAKLATKYGLNLEDYTTKQLGGLFTTFDEDKFIDDAYKEEAQQQRIKDELEDYESLRSKTPTSTQKATAAPDFAPGITGTQIRGSELLTNDQMTDRGNWKGSDYDGDGQDDERTGTSGFDNPQSESYGALAKGGLLAPKTPRKPKTKQTNTRGRGLARKK